MKTKPRTKPTFAAKKLHHALRPIHNTKNAPTNDRRQPRDLSRCCRRVSLVVAATKTQKLSTTSATCDRRLGRRPSFHRNVEHDFRRNYMFTMPCQSFFWSALPLRIFFLLFLKLCYYFRIPQSRRPVKGVSSSKFVSGFDSMTNLLH